MTQVDYVNYCELVASDIICESKECEYKIELSMTESDPPKAILYSREGGQSEWARLRTMAGDDVLGVLYDCLYGSEMEWAAIQADKEPTND